jgi:hypothetical protein
MVKIAWSYGINLRNEGCDRDQGDANDRISFPRLHGCFTYKISPSREALNCSAIARTVLEDICDKPIRIQSYCAVARLQAV